MIGLCPWSIVCYAYLKQDFYLNYCGKYSGSVVERVLDSRPRGPVFETHRRHWVVVLELDTFILA